MQHILWRAALAAIAMVGASVTLVVAIFALLGYPIVPSDFAIGASCGLAIAIPCCALFVRQAHRLRQANAALCYAHVALMEKVRHDDMTGMLNRAGFFEAFDRARAEHRTGALLIIDADNFKRINDGYGHPAGDRALVKIAAAIQGAIRDGDLVGRIGGEEFAAFLPGCNAEEQRVVAERIRQDVERVRFEPRPGLRHRLSVSIGAARHSPERGLSELMREADRWLYEAKRSGRNRVVIEPVIAIAA